MVGEKLLDLRRARRCGLDQRLRERIGHRQSHQAQGKPRNPPSLLHHERTALSQQSLPVANYESCMSYSSTSSAFKQNDV